MPRATSNVPRHKRKKRLRKLTKGYRHARRHLLKEAKIAVRRSGKFSYRDRKVRAREFRSLWIIRLNGAASQHGLRYSQLINGLNLAGITLNRKMLSEIAIADPAGFEVIIKAVKAALDKKAAQQKAAAKSA
jgi:large subunit ribosomal protein L20